MHSALTRLRVLLRRPTTSDANEEAPGAACSWDAMRLTYEEQAARGIPEAIEGLELIKQGRWPTSGRRRDGSSGADASGADE
jgi:hypothetical protein